MSVGVPESKLKVTLIGIGVGVGVCAKVDVGVGVGELLGGDVGLIDVYVEVLAVEVGEVDVGTVDELDGVGVALFEGFTDWGCWLSTYNDAITNIIAVIAIPKYMILIKKLELPISLKQNMP